MRTYLAGLLLVAVSSSLLVAQTDPPELLSLSAGVPREHYPSRAGVEVRRVHLNRGALHASERRMRLKLFDGEPREIRMRSFEARGADDLTWRGNFADSPGLVTLTLKHGFIGGLLYAPDGVYELSTLADGSQVIMKIDQSRYQGCATDGRIVGMSNGGSGAVIVDPDPTVMDDGTVWIDVMAVYTPQARLAAGGDQAMQAQVQAAVDVANTAFQNSAMHAWFRLVYAGPANHSDTDSFETDLNWVTGDDVVARMRDSYGADLVSLFVEHDEYCGMGHVMRRYDKGQQFANRGFQVTSRECAVGNLSYAHEHGHNMGMEHDPDNGAPPELASFPWSYGHFVDGVFRSVMSYDTGCSRYCQRVAYFSNPNVFWGGYPTGIADRRDNHRTGQITAGIVANFRSRPSPPPPPEGLNRPIPWLQLLLP
jgi:hypothetical protein